MLKFTHSDNDQTGTAALSFYSARCGLVQGRSPTCERTMATPNAKVTNIWIVGLQLVRYVPIVAVAVVC